MPRVFAPNLALSHSGNSDFEQLLHAMLNHPGTGWLFFVYRMVIENLLIYIRAEMEFAGRIVRPAGRSEV
jgi:hypothetical protein